MIPTTISTFLVLLTSCYFQVTDAKYILIRFDAENHNNELDSKIGLRSLGRSFSTGKRKLNSTSVMNQITSGCKCNCLGECVPPGCNGPRTQPQSSRSLAGLF